MTIEIPLKDLLPNPFRKIETYRINEEKVEELIASFKSTHFWPNIVGRKTAKGKVEIAYGHHRREAGKRLYGNSHKVEVIIQDLDDAAMIKMMAAENGDFWKTDFIVEMENVETVVEQYAAGIIQLPAPWQKSKVSDLRYAPSFLTASDNAHAREVIPLMREQLGNFWDY
jgi:ParB/RepB/Spo0J family partition protein